jgi:hypothetical protein
MPRDRIGKVWWVVSRGGWVLIGKRRGALERRRRNWRIAVVAIALAVRWRWWGLDRLCGGLFCVYDESGSCTGIQVGVFYFKVSDSW